MFVGTKLSGLLINFEHFALEHICPLALYVSKFFLEKEYLLQQLGSWKDPLYDDTKKKLEGLEKLLISKETTVERSKQWLEFSSGIADLLLKSREKLNQIAAVKAYEYALIKLFQSGLDNLINNTQMSEHDLERIFPDSVTVAQCGSCILLNIGIAHHFH